MPYAFSMEMERSENSNEFPTILKRNSLRFLKKTYMKKNQKINK